MDEEHQQNEILSNEQLHWIGGTTFVHDFDELYDLDDLIHQGIFGDIYKCRLKDHPKIQAVKCIKKHGTRTTPIRNVLLMIQLNHPNLVMIRDIVETPSHIFIVQDYINGLNLLQKIVQTETYREYDLSNYCRQVLKGLEYMHERKIHHGRIHAENILIHTVDNEERVCLVDFTYANLCTRDAIHMLVKMSPMFCAPEILRGESFSSSSDVWQLGIMIFFCLSGKYPFSGTKKQILKNVLQGKIDFNILDWDQVSMNGRTFVSNLLRVNTRDRWTVYDALAQPWIHEKVYRSEFLHQARANIINSSKNNI